MSEKDGYVTFESYEEYESGEGIVEKHEGEEKECEFKREIVAERVEEKKDVEVVREDKALEGLDVLVSDMRVIQRVGNYIVHLGEDGGWNSCVIYKEMKNV